MTANPIWPLLKQMAHIYESFNAVDIKIMTWLINGNQQQRIDAIALGQRFISELKISAEEENGLIPGGVKKRQLSNYYEN